MRVHVAGEALQHRLVLLRGSVRALTQQRGQVMQVAAERRQLGVAGRERGNAIASRCAGHQDRDAGDQACHEGTRRESGSASLVEGRASLLARHAKRQADLLDRLASRCDGLARTDSARSSSASYAMSTSRTKPEGSADGVCALEQRRLQAAHIDADAISRRGCHPESPDMRSVSDIGAVAPILHSPTHSVLARIRWFGRWIRARPACRRIGARRMAVTELQP